MTRTQRTILVFAITVGTATSLFPPTAWIEAIPIANERGFVVDSHGIYHDEPGLISHRGLRFVGHASESQILWNVLVAEWTVLAAISVCLIYFCRSKRSSNAPASNSEAAQDHCA